MAKQWYLKNNNNMKCHAQLVSNTELYSPFFNATDHDALLFTFYDPNTELGKFWEFVSKSSNSKPFLGSDGGDFRLGRYKSLNRIQRNRKGTHSKIECFSPEKVQIKRKIDAQVISFYSKQFFIKLVP